MSKQQAQLVEVGNRWREKPSTMVKDLFGATPDNWQEEALDSYPYVKRLAMKANKGPGKSATEAWIAWNFLLTRNQPNIIATSISGDNLKDGLWKEMSFWHGKSPLLKAAFTITSTRIEAKQDPRNWFMSARTWPKKGSAQEQADSLAGFHSENTLAILDEAGGIPDGVMAAAEATMAGPGEHHIIMAGNPTHREGPLWRACTTNAHQWKVITITGDPDNPKRSPRVPVDWCREQIETYGRDHPYVLVNVFGEFPPHSFNALIGDDEIDEAMSRHYREHDLVSYPRILGIDVAYMGDDQSVIARRHGLQAFPFIRRRNVENGRAGATLTNRIWDEFSADAAFIDATGGFGLSWYDCLNDLGRAPIPVGFAQKASLSERYYNRRAEIYFLLVQWIRQGGALPSLDAEGSRELKKALVNTTFTIKGDRLILEEKADIKSKIGFSPDEADALALTFAEQVAVKAQMRPANRNASSDWNPFRNSSGIEGGRSNAYASMEWNPFR